MNRNRIVVIYKTISVSALVWLLGAAWIASAEDFVDGVNAHNRGQYENAMRILNVLQVIWRRAEPQSRHRVVYQSG